MAKRLDRKYVRKSPLKVALLARMIAKSIDFFLAFILSVLIYPLGVILALGYLASSDYLLGGQSIGKKIIGFYCISLEDNLPCNIKQSIIRNLPFLIPLFFLIIPFWGVFFFFILGLPGLVLEIYLLLKLDSGYRLGDVMADTTVVSSTSQGAMAVKRKKWFDDDSSSEVIQ